MLQDSASNPLALEMREDSDVRQVGVVSTSATGSSHASKRALIPRSHNMPGIDDQVTSLTGATRLPANTVSDQLVSVRCQPAGLYIDAGPSLN